MLETLPSGTALIIMSNYKLQCNVKNKDCKIKADIHYKPVNEI